MAATTPPKKKKANAADVLNAAKPVERVVKVCVAGDLVAEYEAAHADMERAQQAADSIAGRLSGHTEGGQDTATALARRVRELEEQMAERTFGFRLRAVSGKRWADLLAEHPNKDKNKLFNEATFIPAAIAACCVEPEGFLDDVEKVAELFDTLTSGQQADLFEGVWEVNQAAPKELTSSAASAILLRSATTSTTAPSEESPAASSSG